MSFVISGCHNTLPLILDIVENIGIKKVFTKLDLQWGYDNVQIKQGDKWNMAFMTLEGLCYNSKSLEVGQ